MEDGGLHDGQGNNIRILINLSLWHKMEQY